MKRYPKKFVGLHSHSTFSIGDAIGTPQDHIRYALENEMDALALTDHGNMNGYSHQYFFEQKLKKKGVNFKALPGIEAYFVDSLSRWRELYDADREEKRLKKLAAKGDPTAAELLRQKTNAPGDPFAEVKQTMDENMAGGTVVENEEESKANKFKDPLKQRNHLVLLPKNNEGLQALFELVSESYKNGFYRYPRMDLDMLKKYSKGNIIALTACVGGPAARKVFDYQTDPEWDNWGPTDENFEAIQNDLKDLTEKFKWAMGDENFYMEMQFNSLAPQHLVNQHMIEASKRTNTPLVVTCDAHYSRPEHWKEREIYKMMAWASKGQGFDKSKLPQKIEDLKCELHPKNAEQVWESYKRYTKDKGWDFYDDDVVCDAIERTHTIAHDQIGTITPDTSIKLPAIPRMVDKFELETIYTKVGVDADEDLVAFHELKRQAIEGLKRRSLTDKQEYIDRVKHELKVIKHLKFSKYFLTYSKIMELASEHMLTGISRGCFLPGSRVKMADRMFSEIESILKGDKVIDAFGNEQVVENVLEFDIDEECIELEFDNGKVIKCTKDHEILTLNRGWIEAQHLTEEDDIKEV